MIRHLIPALLLAACGPDAGSGGSTARYYFSYDPRSLDPALSTDVPTGEAVALLFDNLTRFDADGRLVPGLAASWEADSAGRTYTFHLRRGPAFHDGRAIRAADVRASFLRVLSPSSTGGRAWPLLPIAGARAYNGGKADSVAGIGVRDDSTVVLTLAEPLNFFPKLLAMPVAAIVPTPTPADFDQQPVGSGPWRFVSWAHDAEMVLAKNPSYWGGPPHMDPLRIRIIPEPLTRAAEYEAGQLSVVEIPFGETRGPLKDPRVRRAPNHAVDVGTILRTLMSDRGVRSAGAIPPGLDGHDPSRTPYAYDRARARRLLMEAGIASGLELRLWRSQRPEYARVAQAVQQSLGQVKVEIGGPAGGV
ncbi:MAG: ABC transporter substrate-binding protein [Gemmatimonadales bacterium]